MLKMFAENRGSYVCEHTVNTEHEKRREQGVFRYMANGEKVTVGNIGENSRSLSADVDITDGKLTVNFWDTCAEGEDQNRYDLVCENGKSSIIHYNSRSNEVICEGCCELTGSSAHVEIETGGDGFTIRINGVQIHKAVLKSVPNISAVCTVDETACELIIKLVNITEKDIAVNINSDIQQSDKASVTALTAESMESGNSFEFPEAVVPTTNEVVISDGTLNIAARSVNVIRPALIR